MEQIKKIQETIVKEFSMLDGDREMMITYIIDLGQKLPPMDSKAKVEDNLINGCQSKIWMTASMQKGRVFFYADSNTSITKGLASFLIRILSGQPPDDILQSNLSCIEDIKMSRFIGTQRSGGLAAMMKQMKFFALAFKTQCQSHEQARTK